MVFAPSVHPNPDCITSVSSEPTSSQAPQFELQLPPRYTQPRCVLIFQSRRTKLKITSHWYQDPRRSPVCISSEPAAISETFMTLCNLQLYWQPQKQQKTQSPLTQISHTSQNRDLCLESHFCFVLILPTSQPQADVHGEKKNQCNIIILWKSHCFTDKTSPNDLDSRYLWSSFILTPCSKQGQLQTQFRLIRTLCSQVSTIFKDRDPTASLVKS